MKIFRKMMPLAIAAAATVALIGMNSFAAGKADISNPTYGGTNQAYPVVITFPTTENYLDINCISRGYYKLKTVGDKKATIIITGVDQNVDLGNLVSLEDKTTPIQTAITINPGEEFDFYSKGDTSSRLNFAVVYDGETLKEVAASTDESKPMDITAGTSVDVPEVSSGTYYYYKLHLDAYSRISVADDSTYNTFYAKPLGETDNFNLYTDFRINSEKDVKVYAPGDYIVRLDARPNTTAPKFGIKAVAINLGTVKCKVPESFERTKETSFDVELVGADSDVTINSVSIYSGNEVISNNNGDVTFKQKGTAKLLVRKAANNAVLKITVGGPMKGVVTVLEKSVKVQEQAVSYTVTAGTDFINFKTLELPTGGNNGKMALQIKKGGKWKTHQTVDAKSNMLFRKLKPATKYTVRLVRIVDGVEGTPSKETTLWTGYKTAPACTISIKRNGTYKTDKYWSPGYWSGSIWHSGYWVKSKTMQKVVITVKLKKKLKGIKGLYINGTHVKGKGLTFKVNKAYPVGQGKTIINVASYMDEKTGGYSKSMSKSVKI